MGLLLFIGYKILLNFIELFPDILNSSQRYAIQTKKVFTQYLRGVSMCIILRNMKDTGKLQRIIHFISEKICCRD